MSQKKSPKKSFDEFTNLCQKGNFKKVSEYYDEKEEVDFDQFDSDNITALIAACYSNNLKTVEYIVEHGGDVNLRAKNCMQFTPLMIACSKENADIVEYLINHEANKSLTDGSGNDALYYTKYNAHKTDDCLSKMWSLLIDMPKDKKSMYL